MDLLHRFCSARSTGGASLSAVGAWCATAGLILALGGCGGDTTVSGPAAKIDVPGTGGDIGTVQDGSGDASLDQIAQQDVGPNDAQDVSLPDLQIADQGGDATETTAVDGAGDVSATATLCNPCNSDADCGNGSLCVPHYTGGSFCASLCTDTCPTGYLCTPYAKGGNVCAPPVNNGQVGADFGECACSPEAIAAGLSTACSIPTADAACIGKRVCSAAGLSACDAPAPATETCDGKDNNCNGQTDEGSLCDDGNPCTTDACNGAAGCSHTANTASCDLDGNPCTEDVCAGSACTAGPAKVCADDGNPCTNDVCDPSTGCTHPFADGKSCSAPGAFCATGTCLSGACANVIANGCDDKNVCTTDACDAATGICSNTPVAGTCNDGNACTDLDTCGNGTCTGTAIVCNDGNACTIDSCDPQKGCTVDLAMDGTPCEDGDKCTIGDNCQAGKCATGQPVVCTATQACHTSTCDTATGQCAVNLAADGTACNDGNACTLIETCTGGVCGGAPITCNDQNPCTDDVCDPAVGCVFTANVSACEDGNACTSPDICADKACSAGAAKSCDDGNPCTADTCDPKTGECLHGAQAGTCDDGQICTTNDACVAGVCTGEPLSCDDLNPCTDDTCDAKKGCVHTATVLTNVPCDDGNACTIGDACTAGVCAGPGTLNCNDNNACTDDSCDPKNGCVHADNSAACDDGNACTTGDKCSGGTCTAGAFTCQCKVTADCAAKEDGNLCNGTLICQASTCQIDPATVVTCGIAGNTTCTANTCTPATGLCAMAPIAEGQPCEDGSLCTANDSCKSGTCTGGPAIVCNDNNPCTDDSCDALKGCVYANNSAPCNDGSACTSVDTCQGGVCVGTAAQCDDGNACTNDGCDAKGGCTHAFNTLACDDGNVCTLGDACAGGVCLAGTATKTCDDGNLCTTDSCDAVKGCVFADNTLPCNDNNVCTSGETCLAGKCQPGTLTKICNDNVSCTADSCDPATGACIFKPIIGCGGNCLTNSDCPSVQGGCQTGVCNAATLKCGTTPAPAGTACSTNNACVTGQTCSAFGNCNGGTQKVCDDANPCTADTCQAGTGTCIFTPTGPIACNDQNSCTVGDFCSAGTCIGGSAKPCNDFNPCTADSCDKATGNCVYTAIAGCSSTCKVDSDCAVSADPCQVNYCDVAKSACASKAAANLTPCNDKNACSATDVCFGGVCQGTAFKTCNDLQLCTTDTCDAATGNCVYTPNALPCTDNDPCTQPDVCAAGACVPGAVKVCNDNNPCTADSCNKNNGNCRFQGIPGCGGFCASNADCPAPANTCATSTCDMTTQQCTGATVADGTVCNDNNACTSASTCQAGTCIGTGTKICNDGNACTFDSCNTQTGACVFNNQFGNACSDGNPCTTNDFCQQGTCHAGNQKVCNDGNNCTADSCDQASGQCLFVPIAGCGGNCNTTADCPATGNVCTTSVCSQTLKQCVVQNVQNQTTCDDGLPCTTNDACQNGKCLGGAQKNCNDQNNCTTDSCDAATGNCLHAPQTGNQCNDGSPCTNNDTCAAGVCTGTAKTCDDGQPCTADSCNPLSGNCQHQNIQGCGGACKVATDCPTAANVCTPYVCSAGLCAISQATAGTTCSDGNPCTSGDSCFAGSCVSGLQKDCNDNNVCTVDACSQQTGACTHQNLQFQAQCNDNNACTNNDHCTNGVCGGNQKNCNDQNPCTTDSCNTTSGNCVFTPKNCNDNNACTTDSCNPQNGNCLHVAIPGC